METVLYGVGFVLFLLLSIVCFGKVFKYMTKVVFFTVMLSVCVSVDVFLALRLLPAIPETLGAVF